MTDADRAHERMMLGLEGEARLTSSARMSSLPRLGFTWSGVLLSATPVLGGIIVTQKSPTAGFPLGLVGLIAGYAIGAAAMGWLSTWGPRTGLGQMPLNRLAFGRGNVVPEAVLVFSLLLWSAINLVFGVSAIATALGVPFAVAVSVVALTQLSVGLLGYRAFERLGLVITACMAVVLVALVVGAAGQMPPVEMFPADAIVSVDGIAFGIAFGLGNTYSWTVQANDTARNLPEGTSGRRTFWTVWTAMFVPLSLLGLLGGWIGTAMAVDEPMQRMKEVLGGGLIASVALVAMGLALAAENGYNDLSNVIVLRRWGLRWPRRLLSAASTLVAVSIAVVLRVFPLGELQETAAVVLGYFCAPLFGVVAIELARRRRQARTWEVPAPAPLAATAAFVLAFVGLFAFTAADAGAALAMDVPGFAWVGALPRMALHGIEGGYLAGTIIAALLYLAFAPLERRWRQPSS